MVVGLTLAMLAAGCVSRTERHYYSTATVPATGSVTVATAATPPPAPREELPGPPPGEGYVWISGYWAYENGRYEWVPGHYEAPRAGYRWVPYRWVQENGRWRMDEGHWETDVR
jgi:hypothetical protein